MTIKDTLAPRNIYCQEQKWLLGCKQWVGQAAACNLGVMSVLFAFKEEKKGKEKKEKANKLEILRPVKDDEVLSLLG